MSERTDKTPKTVKFLVGSLALAITALYLSSIPSGAPATPAGPQVAATPQAQPEVTAVAAPPKSYPTYTSKDVADQLTDNEQKYVPLIVKWMNRIVRENSDCARVEALGLSAEDMDKRYIKNPTFYADCYTSDGTAWSASATKAQILGRELLAADEPVGKVGAVMACEQSAKNRSTHPSTVDFARIWNDFTVFPNGRRVLESTFSNKNGFGLQVNYKISCDFQGNTLTAVDVHEDGS